MRAHGVVTALVAIWHRCCQEHHCCRHSQAKLQRTKEVIFQTTSYEQKAFYLSDESKV
jgi:hypothetical protein